MKQIRFSNIFQKKKWFSLFLSDIVSAAAESVCKKHNYRIKEFGSLLCEESGTFEKSYFKNSLICHTKSLICRAKSLICRTKSLIFQTKSLICRTKSLICRNKSLICRTKSLICRTKSLIGRTNSLICRTKSHQRNK